MSNPAKYLVRPDQLATVRSLKEIYKDHSFYTMEYQADYRLDDVLKESVVTGEDLQKVLQKKLIVDRLPVPKTGGNCTIFTARDKKGHVLIGRNLDFRHDPHTMLIRTSPAADHRAIGMADLGFLPAPKGFLTDGKTDISLVMMVPYLVLDGMNEKGLFIGVMQLKFPATRQDRGRIKLTTTEIIRAVLDKAADVGEAVALFEKYDIQSPMDARDYHFLVADRSGKRVVIEYVDNEMHLLDDDCCTNFYLTPEKEKLGGGKARYEIVKKVLDFRAGILEKREMMDLLHMVCQPAGPQGRSNTLWSAVYDLTDLTMQVVIDHRYYGRPLRYSLAEPL